MIRALLLTLFLAGCAPSAETPPVPPAATPAAAVASTIGGPAPDIAFAGLAGDTLRLNDYRGKVILVNFWATWCAPCREEIPDLIALQDKLGSEDFVVLGVASILYDEDAAEVSAFVAEHGMHYPIVLDKGPAGTAFGGVFALPTTYIIDRDFTLRQRTIGLPDQSLEPFLAELIAAD
ncbi:MAG: TlpA disulfide reductase family protein [Rhodothermales bacterium]|nr:TlpA disulfide reductase family protein [Rhodothermales bacterium]